MCGITGWIGHNKVSIAKKHVKKMNDALFHRGPDGEGTTLHENVILAMRRLAIIDVSGGQQPLFTEDKNIAIVGNGEIYNYLELQKKLIKKGHELKTGSDIEVFAHLFEDYGWQAVKKLRGMFALALHDRKNKKVFLFRDRLGEKPLVYTILNNNIYFASEIKAILELPINKQLNYQAIDDYFHAYYVPEPKTPFVSVQKLPAGCVLEIDCESLEITTHEYWKIENLLSINKSDPTLQIKKNFDDSCKITLRSDVPVAISLSSGIDSSAIATLANKHSKANLVALTVGYKNAKKVDERVAAKELTKKLKMKHIISEMIDTSIVQDFPKLIWNCDDLLAEIGMFNINAIYESAKENKIKVLLAGIGGDELFWGYPWFRIAAHLTLSKWKYCRSSSYKFWNHLIPDFAKNLKVFNKTLGKLNFLFSPENQLIMANSRPPFKSGQWITKFYSPVFYKRLDKNNRFNFLNYQGSKTNIKTLKHMMKLLIQRWLSSHVIPINDRLAMANSIEVRLPILDYKLIETVFSHQKTVSAFDKAGKHYFRSALQGVLSDEIMNRPKKGFTPPVARWLWQLIINYFYLLNNGFVVQENIINQKCLLSLKLSILFPWRWYSLFQIIVLEIWGREFVWGQKFSEIYSKNK